VLCNRCATNLPRGSQFCLKCGQPVIFAAKGDILPPLPAVEPGGTQPLGAPRRGRIIPLSLLFLLLLGAGVWAGTSDSAEAQRVQDLVHWSQTQTIVDAALSVNPHSFSAREFTVPPGALKVSITGEFSATAGSPRSGNVNGTEKDKDRDPGIEAYVLTDTAFTVWSTGYSAPTQYESGPLAAGAIDAPLPAGAGVYHLVFSNRGSPRAKTVHATVLLRYRSWLPYALLSLKERLWNWLGL
jgi:hypothetical protein